MQVITRSNSFDMPNLNNSSRVRKGHKAGTQKKPVVSTAPCWERQPGESAKAFEAFRVYRDAGPDRSVVGTCRRARRRPGAAQADGRWKTWRAKHNWESRAAAYDTHFAAIEQQAKEKERGKRATEMEQRRQQAQDDAWALSEQMRAKIQQMLKVPVAQRGAKRAGVAKWDYNSLSRFADALLKVTKLGAGLDPALATTLNIDVKQLTDDQIDRIAAGEDPASVLATRGTTNS